MAKKENIKEGTPLKKYPNEYWLRYLIVVSNLENNAIYELAKLYSFAVPSTDYLEWLRVDCELLAAGLDLNKETDFDSWLRKLKIYPLAKNDKDAIKARELLSDYNVRPVLETLIIADVDRDEIGNYCSEITGVRPNRKIVEFFEHFFWNRKLLSYSDWGSYLLELNDKSNYYKLLGCYNSGKEHALWKLGYRVSLDQEEALKSMLHESYMRFFETSLLPPGRDTAMTTKMYVESVMSILDQQRKNNSDKALKDVVGELRQISIKLGNKKTPSMKELMETKK